MLSSSQIIAGTSMLAPPFGAGMEGTAIVVCLPSLADAVARVAFTTHTTDDVVSLARQTRVPTTAEIHVRLSGIGRYEEDLIRAFRHFEKVGDGFEVKLNSITDIATHNAKKYEAGLTSDRIACSFHTIDRACNLVKAFYGLELLELAPGGKRYTGLTPAGKALWREVGPWLRTHGF